MLMGITSRSNEGWIAAPKGRKGVRTNQALAGKKNRCLNLPCPSSVRAENQWVWGCPASLHILLGKGLARYPPLCPTLLATSWQTLSIILTLGIILIHQSNAFPVYSLDFLIFLWFCFFPYIFPSLLCFSGSHRLQTHLLQLLAASPGWNVT